MKHVLISLLGLLLVFGLASCGKDDPAEVASDAQTPESPDGNADGAGQTGRTLVVYFSRKGYNYPNQWLEMGNTARVAGHIADLTGGDLFELVPVVPYPDDYQEAVALARDEYDNNARPAIKNTIENLDEYDTLFVGGPVWHGAMPMIIRTFYESYDLSGKTIVPFSTHAGSGLGDCERLARSYYPDNAILQGLAVQGTNSANARGDVEAWLTRIGVIK
ncbi:MAG: flavodoxin [Marinilabiliaceae bacterium]